MPVFTVLGFLQVLKNLILLWNAVKKKLARKDIQDVCAIVKIFFKFI